MKVFSSSNQKSSNQQGIAIHWFRKCLRLHDNRALLEAVSRGKFLIPLFILDPWFTKPDKVSPLFYFSSKVGTNRMGFLLESLEDLDKQMKQQFNSKLIILKGNPAKVFPKLLDAYPDINLLTFEKDTEPYAEERDKTIIDLFEQRNKSVETFAGHTLMDMDELMQANDYSVPLSYTSFQTLFKKLGKVPQPLMDPLPEFPPLPVKFDFEDAYLSIPSLAEIGYEKKLHTSFFRGGEKEGLRKMNLFLTDRSATASFEKPKTNPTSIKPDTTALSPYLK